MIYSFWGVLSIRQVISNSWSHVEAVWQVMMENTFDWLVIMIFKFWWMIFPVLPSEELSAVKQAGILFSHWLCILWMQWLHCAWRWIFLVSDFSHLKASSLDPLNLRVSLSSHLITWPLPDLPSLLSICSSDYKKPAGGEYLSLPLQGNVCANTHLLESRNSPGASPGTV